MAFPAQKDAAPLGNASEAGGVARASCAATILPASPPFVERLRVDAASTEEHLLAAERSVLGAMLLHPDAVHDVADLSRADFMLPKHATIFSAILATANACGQTDPLMVGDTLARLDRLVEVGGINCLLDLADSCVTAATVGYHAGLVRDGARRRLLADVALDLAQQARDGGDPDELLAQLARRVESRQRAGRRMRLWSAVADDPAVTWLVDGLVPAGGLVVLAGDPGSGKTLLALDVALRGAHGQDWLGRRVRPCSTVYLAGEGSTGLGARMRAWRAAHPAALPIDGHYVAVVDGVPDLTAASAAAEIDGTLSEALRQHGRAPDVLVVDTLAMAAPGTDENDAGAMGSVLAALAEVRRRHGVTIQLIHHTRKPGPRERQDTQHALRGSSAIAGAADVVLLAAADGDVRVIRAVKVRDGEAPAPLRYVIAGQDTGRMLDDGRHEQGPIVLPAPSATTCTPVADDAAARQEGDVAAVIAAIEQHGPLAPLDAVGPLAGVPRDRARIAVRLAVTRRLVVSGGSTRDRWYDSPTRAANRLASNVRCRLPA